MPQLYIVMTMSQVCWWCEGVTPLPASVSGVCSNSKHSQGRARAPTQYLRLVDTRTPRHKVTNYFAQFEGGKSSDEWNIRLLFCLEVYPLKDIVTVTKMFSEQTNLLVKSAWKNGGIWQLWGGGGGLKIVSLSFKFKTFHSLRVFFFN